MFCLFGPSSGQISRRVRGTFFHPKPRPQQTAEVKQTPPLRLDWAVQTRFWAAQTGLRAGAQVSHPKIGLFFLCFRLLIATVIIGGVKVASASIRDPMWDLLDPLSHQDWEGPRLGGLAGVPAFYLRTLLN